MKTSFILVALAAVFVGVIAEEHETFGLVGNATFKGDAEFVADIVRVRLGILGSHICNGALIAPQWIVAPVQCVPNNKGIGKLWEKYTATIGGANYDFAEIIEHPQAANITRDIALVRLTERVKSVRPVILPAPNANPQGAATVYLREKKGGPVNYLNVTIKDRSQCSGAAPAPLDDSHLCVGNSTGLNSKDLLGSPLVVPGNGKDQILVGYLSFASDKPVPAVYTRISYYIDYIKNIINKKM